MTRYEIVRFYMKNKSPRRIMGGLTLSEAQAYCKDPETSSETCTKASGKACTRRNGPWFDGYREE